MTGLILLILLAAALFAWWGKRKPALICFAFILIFSLALFLHHITSHLKLDL